jgi:ABC-type transport system involved in Fe-S cluster assembly fused permease/ATPase subunit
MLDKGQIAETGAHDDLIRTESYYASTWRLQEIEEELNAF